MRPPHQAQFPLKEEMEISRTAQYCHHQPRVQNVPSVNMLNISPVVQVITVAYWNLSY